jgi:hypothetical protein
MSERRIRKRFMVGNRKKVEGVEDELAFEANRSSPNARKIIKVKPNLIVELWFDKHYYKRHHEGDDSGKREGIDPETVLSLVTRSLEHLFIYGSLCKGFNFVNHETVPEFPHRIVLMEEVDASILNVVIEVHYIDYNRFEVTVMTAMVVDNFRMPAGQFCIEIHQEHSVLKKQEKGKLSEVSSI